MNLNFTHKFSFLNLMVYLLIINLIISLIFFIFIFPLYFFKVPISNLVYVINEYSSELPLLILVFLPLLISNILTVYLIPLNFLVLIIENICIKNGIILPKIKIKFSKRKKIILYTIIVIAILAYLFSLGAWIHTMIPYTPEELERLRYD